MKWNISSLCLTKKQMNAFALLTALLVLTLVVVWILRRQGDERGCTECPDAESSDVSTTKKFNPPMRMPSHSEDAKKPSPMRKPAVIVPQPRAVPTDAWKALRTSPKLGSTSASPSPDIVSLAAEKRQLMDDLLNEEQIPSDYGEVMVSLFRDRSQDVYTRDFAVQHVGLYAEALHRRGSYDPSSAEVASLRRALVDAADETRTIVAAAALRALDDLSAFDSHIDANRLDSRLVECVADTSASLAVRVMAVQLCGERGIVSASGILKRMASDSNENTVVRMSAARTIYTLEGR